MKKILFMLAFMLMGAISFANNSEPINEEPTSLFKNEINLDSDNSKLFLFFKKVTKDYLDSCGNHWTVTYDDEQVSDFDAYLIAGAMIYEITGGC